MRAPDQSAGTRPWNRNHVVVHGAPQAPPTANGSSSSHDGPISTANGARCGCTSGSTRSTSSRRIRSSTTAGWSNITANRRRPTDLCGADRRRTAPLA